MQQRLSVNQRADYSPSPFFFFFFFLPSSPPSWAIASEVMTGTAATAEPTIKVFKKPRRSCFTWASAFSSDLITSCDMNSSPWLRPELWPESEAQSRYELFTKSCELWSYLFQCMTPNSPCCNLGSIPQAFFSP